MEILRILLFDQVDLRRWPSGLDGRRGSFFDRVGYLSCRGGFEGEFVVFIKLGVKSLFFLFQTFVDFGLDKFIHISVGEAWFVGDCLCRVFGD